ncbi:TonB-dependent receptor plug domain-containing protein [Flavobacterium jejuense]|uniref:TonB-dependent receptor plug domain-containing protein n=1 Tax=Flavobacterium jejuense TaxID=1544455 RepID=A0ABX0IVB5_9FLAO|nr:TonB-dependent receptor [Flavobacterium jejuense]NHN27121.1 TonB-dependent receptor plug domain-containing protein [Flavobacterium jejuense]
MRVFKQLMILGLFLITTQAIFSQSKITGMVIDGDFNDPLPGANVFVKGTKDGATTGFDGKFEFTTSLASGEIVVSYLGFKSVVIPFTGSTNLGNVSLKSDENQLEGVVVVGSGIIDLASDRKTPIAVSTIKAIEIQEKVGTSDITQAMVNTPSVYVADQSRGYGDSNIRVRGFEQDNTAVLINGQPVNGMEDGLVYWSNWSGLTDIANGIQIQRGLGSSKLAISSVGGTINIVTKATDKKEGGFASLGVANNSYFKTLAGYNTGMNEKGWGMSIMMSHWQGEGYTMGTQGRGQNYFISVGYKPSDKHNFNFLLTGAPQYHNQSYSQRISTYLDKGRKYNNNWGTLDGKFKSEVGNYYHKPVANLNWDYTISDNSNLSTVLYASWGRGGSVGSVGSRVRRPDGQIDFDQIYANNVASATGRSTYALRNSVNSHEWYGLITNFETKFTDELTFNAGFDLRTYKGTHFRQITDLLGADYFLDNGNVNIPNNQISATYDSNPWSALFNYADEGERYAWDYDERITYGGVFSQIEYSNDKFSAFFQGALSNQSHVRWDRYQYLPENEKSKGVDNIGYNAKGGMSYNVNENNSVYGNAGYYSRQPYHDNIYLNFGNDVNPLTENEKILGLELGYSFNSSYFSANLNAYRTSWKDRVTSSSTTATAGQVVGTTVLNDGDIIYTTNQGVEQLHSGVELDFTARPIKKLNLRGFASIGDWQYKGDVVTVKRDQDRNVLEETKEDVDGGEVGGAAQTSWGLGVKYEIFTRFNIDADWRNYNKLYSDVGAVKENLELPEYDLVDAGISYKMLVGKDDVNSVSFRLNVNNVFGQVYLASLSTTNQAVDGDETFKGINVTNTGYFGLGRTWNFSIRYNF